MHKLTKYEINSLKKVEEFFKQIKEGYKRASSVKEDVIVAEIYERITGKKETNFACGQCSFRMYKVVGEAYWEALKEVDTIDTKTPTPKKNKTTTKKTKTNDRQRKARVAKEKD